MECSLIACSNTSCLIGFVKNAVAAETFGDFVCTKRPEPCFLR